MSSLFYLWKNYVMNPVGQFFANPNNFKLCLYTAFFLAGLIILVLYWLNGQSEENLV